MVAGTPYTQSTTSTTISTGLSSSTLVTQQTAILTLESAQQSVTVPGGTYLCYVIDEMTTTTSTDTIAGQPPHHERADDDQCPGIF